MNAPLFMTHRLGKALWAGARGRKLLLLPFAPLALVPCLIIDMMLLWLFGIPLLIMSLEDS